jgi:hypothetical protein
MSTRERWIIYPLLFLTLGIAMRNQFLPTRTFGAMDLRAGDLSAQTIRCENLEVLQDGVVHNNFAVMRKESCAELVFGTASGEGLKTNYTQTIQSKTVEGEFRKVTVADEQSKPVILMLEDQNTKSGAILTMRADGAPQVQISPNESGGMVRTVGKTGRVVAMGHEGQSFGVFAQQQFGPPFLLTPPWPLQMPPKLTPNPIPKISPEEKKDDSRQ